MFRRFYTHKYFLTKESIGTRICYVQAKCEIDFEGYILEFGNIVGATWFFKSDLWKKLKQKNIFF